MNLREAKQSSYLSFSQHHDASMLSAAADRRGGTSSSSSSENQANLTLDADVTAAFAFNFDGQAAKREEPTDKTPAFAAAVKLAKLTENTVI